MRGVVQARNHVETAESATRSSRFRRRRDCDRSASCDAALRRRSKERRGSFRAISFSSASSVAARLSSPFSESRVPSTRSRLEPPSVSTFMALAGAWGLPLKNRPAPCPWRYNLSSGDCRTSRRSPGSSASAAWRAPSLRPTGEASPRSGGRHGRSRPESVRSVPGHVWVPRRSGSENRRRSGR